MDERFGSDAVLVLHHASPQQHGTSPPCLSAWLSVCFPLSVCLAVCLSVGGKMGGCKCGWVGEWMSTLAVMVF